MSNPYQPFFNKLDATLVALGDIESSHAADKDAVTDAVDLLTRAGFVLGNLINAQSQVYPMLFLDPPTVEGETDDADTPSVDQPEP